MRTTRNEEENKFTLSERICGVMGRGVTDEVMETRRYRCDHVAYWFSISVVRTVWFTEFLTSTIIMAAVYVATLCLDRRCPTLVVEE